MSGTLGAEVDLAPGYRISRLLKGGWQLAGGHGRIDRDQAIADMFRFAAAGLTTFDCADIYTGVERLIGEFLARWRAERGVSGASAIRVHTKFVPDIAALPHVGRADVQRAIDRSLRRLRVETLDLVQFHWWDYAVPGYVEVAGWLADLRQAGKIRHLGVTNFDVPRLTELLDAGLPIVAHQVQYSLVDRRPEHGMVELCRSRGVGLLCYGALQGGFLSARWLGVPAPGDTLENRSLAKYRLILDEWGDWPLFQALLDALASVSRRHGVGLGSVALRWVLDRPGVAGVIVGARHAAHLDDTRRALALELDDEDRARLDAVLGRAVGPAGDTYALERIPGGRHAAIMRYDLNAAATD